MAAPVLAGEESPDFIGHGALRKQGRGDPTESATETYRRWPGSGYRASGFGIPIPVPDARSPVPGSGKGEIVG